MEKEKTHKIRNTFIVILIAIILSGIAVGGYLLTKRYESTITSTYTKYYNKYHNEVESMATEVENQVNEKINEAREDSHSTINNSKNK